MEVKTFKLADLIGHPRKPETNNVIEEGLLKDNSIMVVGGAPKSYKSFVSNTIAIDLVIARNLFGVVRINHGRPEQGFVIPHPQRVLVLEQEVGEDDLEDRIRPLYDSLTPEQQELAKENLFTHSLDHTLQLDKPDGVKAIEKIIIAVKPTVVIFDPLIEFHTSNENDTQAMTKILRNIDSLREKHRFATIINHHEGKPNAEAPRTGGDRLRGSSAVFGKGDSFLTLKVVNRPAAIIEIEFTIRRGRPIRNIILQLDPITQRAVFKEWKKN